MSPRLEDRIQELCARAVAAREQAEIEETIGELKAAIKEHIHRIRQRVVTFPAPERRRDVPAIKRERPDRIKSVS